MKKIPFLLVALTLGALVTGATSVLATNNDNTEVMARQMLATTGARTIGEESRDILELTPNQYNPWVDIVSFSPYSGRITVRASAGSAAEWQVGKILLVQRDYENGVTEATADARLATLGVDDSSDWAVKLGEDDAHEMYSVNVDVAVPSGKITGNLTNIVYYAVEFGHEYRDDNGVWQMRDSWWVRGKVDYRNCVHSSVFDESLMICNGDFSKVDYRAETGTVEYLPYSYREGKYIDLPENETIPSWDEEWAKILQQRYTEVAKDLGMFERHLRETSESFDEFEERLRKLSKALSGVETMGGYSTMTTELQRGLVKLKKDYFADDGEQAGNSDELAGLKTENADLKTEIANLKGEIADLEEEIVALKEEKADLTAQNEELGAKNEEMERENEELERKNGELVAENERLNQQLLNNSGGDMDWSAEQARLKQENRELLAQIEKLNSDLAQKQECNKVEDNNEKGDDVPQEVIIVQGTGNQAAEATPAMGQVTVMTRPVAEETENNIVTQSEKPESDEAIEVPALGGKKAPLKHVWWFTIPVVLTLGGLIWWFRKRLGADKRR